MLDPIGEFFGENRNCLHTQVVLIVIVSFALAAVVFKYIQQQWDEEYRAVVWTARLWAAVIVLVTAVVAWRLYLHICAIARTPRGQYPAPPRIPRDFRGRPINRDVDCWYKHALRPLVGAVAWDADDDDEGWVMRIGRLVYYVRCFMQTADRGLYGLFLSLGLLRGMKRVKVILDSETEAVGMNAPGCREEDAQIVDFVDHGGEAEFEVIDNRKQPYNITGTHRVTPEGKKRRSDRKKKKRHKESLKAVTVRNTERKPLPFTYLGVPPSEQVPPQFYAHPLYSNYPADFCR